MYVHVLYGENGPSLCGVVHRKYMVGAIQFQFQLPSSKWNFLFFRKPTACLQIIGISVKKPDDQFDIPCISYEAPIVAEHQRCSIGHQTRVQLELLLVPSAISWRANDVSPHASESEGQHTTRCAAFSSGVLHHFSSSSIKTEANATHR